MRATQQTCYSLLFTVPDISTGKITDGRKKALQQKNIYILPQTQLSFFNQRLFCLMALLLYFRIFEASLSLLFKILPTASKL